MTTCKRGGGRESESEPERRLETNGDLEVAARARLGLGLP